MDQQAEFESFYTLKLAPSLEKLRAECKGADKWGIIGLMSFVTGGIILYLGLQLHYLQHYGLPVILLFSVAIFSLFKYTTKKDIFTDDYKAHIIKEIIDHLCPGVTYKPDDTITEHEYKTSSLFRRHYDYFNGSDYMEGVINNTAFHSAELTTQYDDGRTQITIFKGLFFVVKISSIFTGGTYVWARGEEQLPSSIYDEEYRLMPLPPVNDLYFDDKPFEHFFRVCTTYQSQALEILTPAMRQHMVNLRRQTETVIAFSFVAGNCYFAIPAGDDILEPSNYDPGDKTELWKRYLTITLIFNIIKELGLELLD